MLLREIELRDDMRAAAVFHLLLYTGCRVGDLVALELDDLLISERSGSVVFRFGKGNKQRSVPLPMAARKALSILFAISTARGNHPSLYRRARATDRPRRPCPLR